DAVKRMWHVNDTGHGRLRGPAAGVACQRNGARGRPMVGTIARQNFVSAGIETRDPDRVFIGVGAGVGKEKRIDVAGSNLGELGPEPRSRFCNHERVRVREYRRLILNRLDHTTVAVTDIHAHQLAVEIEISPAVRFPEVYALRAGNGNVIDPALRGPLEQRVLLREYDDVVGRE